MTDDAVTDLDAFDAGTNGFDPARIFVPHDVGKPDVDLAPPDASTMCRSVRQTPAPPMRTMTSVGREILGSVTSPYLTNSFAVSFSSNSWRTAAFIDVSPMANFYSSKSQREFVVWVEMSKSCATPLTS
jgi:hypothetical protein